MRRSLELRRERLTELTAADLHVVVGAAIPTQPNAGACLIALSNKVNYTHCLCPTEA